MNSFGLAPHYVMKTRIVAVLWITLLFHILDVPSSNFRGDARS
jgi:hypothetical protein